MAKYEAKIKFINKHLLMDDPFDKKTVLDDDLVRAVEWGASRSDEQVCTCFVVFIVGGLHGVLLR